jgi:hypothetical protein
LLRSLRGLGRDGPDVWREQRRPHLQQFPAWLRGVQPRHESSKRNCGSVENRERALVFTRRS